jgi:Fe2+ transport system protein B
MKILVKTHLLKITVLFCSNRFHSSGYSQQFVIVFIYFLCILFTFLLSVSIDVTVVFNFSFLFICFFFFLFPFIFPSFSVLRFFLVKSYICGIYVFLRKLILSL